MTIRQDMSVSHYKTENDMLSNHYKLWDSNNINDFIVKYHFYYIFLYLNTRKVDAKSREVKQFSDHQYEPQVFQG